jgi:hypothetical protein
VATHIIVLNLAILEPIAEFRKLTASLPTPTTRSTMATMVRTIRPIYKKDSKSTVLMRDKDDKYFLS